MTSNGSGIGGASHFQKANVSVGEDGVNRIANVCSKFAFDNQLLIVDNKYANKTRSLEI